MFVIRRAVMPIFSNLGKGTMHVDLARSASRRPLRTRILSTTEGVTIDEITFMYGSRQKDNFNHLKL